MCSLELRAIYGLKQSPGPGLFEDCVEDAAEDDHVINVQLKDEPGAVVEKDARIVCRYTPLAALHGNLERLIPLPA
jgi:hypothetical protein